MSKRPAGHALAAAWALAGLVLALTACAAQPAASATATQEVSVPIPNLQTELAQELTSVVRRAEATIVVLQAQRTADAMVRAVEAAGESPTPATASTIVSGAGSPDTVQEPARTPAAQAVATPIPFELLGVSYGAEMNLVVVSFKSDPKVADTFWPGKLAVIDEASGTVYNEVAVMPVVGPMISRPKRPGQIGYVMFANPPPGLPPGSLVTVQLAGYVVEHVRVSE